ncbi:MAG: DUF4154 domain-containing protein [Methylococcales bacterium]|nr:DUF4154 domain-containing protein [Methylococcales bacterium]
MKKHLILTLSSHPNFTKAGGMVSFKIDTKPIAFQANLSKFKETYLKSNSSLLKTPTIISSL